MTPKAEDALVKRRKEALTAAFTAKLFLQVGEAVEDIVALVAVDHLAARAMGIGCDPADARVRAVESGVRPCEAFIQDSGVVLESPLDPHRQCFDRSGRASG
jgi:hypothetical protein